MLKQDIFILLKLTPNPVLRERQKKEIHNSKIILNNKNEHKNFNKTQNHY